MASASTAPSSAPSGIIPRLIDPNKFAEARETEVYIMRFQILDLFNVSSIL